MAKKSVNKSHEAIIHDLYKSQNEFYIKGQDFERACIAKDLHDGTSGSLYGIKLHLHFLKNNPNNSSEQIEQIEQIEKHIDMLSIEVKNITKKISPLNLKNYGLSSSMKDLISGIQSQNIRIDFTTNTDSERFKENLEINMYRIFQECINNVIKHADPTHVIITLVLHDSHLQLVIEDNGKGISIPKNHEGNGLSNILFRVQILDGSIDIVSKSDHGTKTTIKVPV